MSVNIAPHLVHKQIVRNINGDIITLKDEENGGYIIRGGKVVNEEAWENYVKKEQDKQKAREVSIKAITNPEEFTNTNASTEDRNTQPSKTEELEKKFDEFKKDVDDKFSQIMKAIQK